MRRRSLGSPYALHMWRRRRRRRVDAELPIDRWSTLPTHSYNLSNSNDTAPRRRGSGQANLRAAPCSHRPPRARGRAYGAGGREDSLQLATQPRPTCHRQGHAGRLRREQWP